MTNRELLKKFLLDAADKNQKEGAEIVIAALDEIFEMKDAVVSIAESLKRLADYHTPVPKSQPAAHRAGGHRAEPPVPGM